MKKLEDCPDVKIIFDTKEKDAFALLNRMVECANEQGFDIYNRFIIQVYSIENYKKTKEIFPDFTEYWYTNYKSCYTFRKMFQLFDEYEDVTTYVLSYGNWLFYSPSGLHTTKKFAVHTVNSPETRKFLASRGVELIYSDWI